MANSEPKKIEIYCLDCKRIVKRDEAALICYPGLHQIIEDDGNLFQRAK